MSKKSLVMGDTKSGRRFAFKSFRDLVDSIKIDPVSDLSKKAFHDVEVSHFLSTLEHWREVNLSKTFQELVAIVEPLSLTLPLLIHHKDVIFQALDESISLNDHLSLGASLELLSQLCHDLGEDFLPFYKRSLEIFCAISLEQKDPESLQMIFNTMAYLFKYLSRFLSKDLSLTIKTLLPLLTVNKDYITRFTSQAVSFLVKKTNEKSYSKLLDDIFDCPEILEDSISSYHNAMSIIFSESFKSASGVLHSKSAILMPLLINKSLENPRYTSIFVDIIMELLDYTKEPKNALPLYQMICESITQKEITDMNELTNCVQMLFALSFGETGKRVSNWADILEMIEVMKQKFHSLNETDEIKLLNFVDSMAIWCAVLIRNCEFSHLAKYHIKILQFMSELNSGSGFLGFIENSIFLSKERILQFSKKYVISFVSKNWKSSHKKIALFLQRMNDQHLISNINQENPDTYQIVIPNEFKLFMLQTFESIKSISSKETLLDFYWRILTLQNTELEFDGQLLINFIDLLMKSEIFVDEHYTFTYDIIGLSLCAISRQQLSDDQYLNALNLIIQPHFAQLITSSTFLENLHLFISSINKSNTKSVQFLSENFNDLITQLVHLLNTQSHYVRLSTLNIIIDLYGKTQDEIPDLVLNCRTIEDVPLVMQNARDIPLRYRQMGQLFEQTKTTPLINTIITNFIFGQLTNKFSPTWTGVIDFLKAHVYKLMDLSWSIAFEIISTHYSSLEDPTYFDYDYNMDGTQSDLLEWYPQDSRILSNIQNAENVLQSYQKIDESLLEFAQSKYHSTKRTDFARYQVIKLFTKIPALPEQNFKQILPYVINEDLEDSSDATSGSLLDGWTMADRNGLIESLSGFKKLNKVEGVEKVEEVLLKLLMNRQTSTQSLALKCILNLKNQIYNKYKKNLENLLDDAVFRDEILLLMQNSEKSPIEIADEPVIIPIILRILFGRAQTLKTNSSKVGRKNAAIMSLNNFKDDYIIQFLELSFYKFQMDNFMENSTVDPNIDVSSRILKYISGFLSLNLEISSSLGKKHKDAISILLNPLMYALSVTEYVIEHSAIFDEADDSSIMHKTARNNRKNGFKLLNQLAVFLDDEFDWSPYSSIIYNNLMKSKMDKFAAENTEDPSSLMKFMSLFVQPNLMSLLYFDDFKPLKAMLNLIGNPNSKDPVLLLALKFVSSLLEISSDDETFIEAISIVVSECLISLVTIFNVTTNAEINTLVVQILLTFVKNDYITNNDIRGVLIDSLTSALEKPNSQIKLEVKADIVNIMASLLEDYECSYEEILPVYKNVSKMYKSYAQREMRLEISRVFQSISGKFDQFEKISHLVIGLNSYDEKRIREPDYETRLDCFSIINETEYLNLTILEWLPVLYCVLFFINDEEDQSMRSSASYTLIRFIDAMNSKIDENTVEEFVDVWKSVVYSALRSGMRKKSEGVRVGYINVIGHAVAHLEHLDDFNDMQILLKYSTDESNEECNFFENIIHLQNFKRQEALRALTALAPKIHANNVAYFLLPMVEHYGFWEVEKERVVSQDAIPAIRKLMQCVTFNQFRAIFIRHLSIVRDSNMNKNNNRLRDSVSMLVADSYAMRQWFIDEETRPNDILTPTRLDTFIITDLIPKIHKILSDREETTVLMRVPLSESLISLIMCCSENQISSELPGLLTRICQMLRSRAEDLRDTVRKHLGRIANSLGSRYLKFIIKELKGSLMNGPQIHILSYTIHYLITHMSSQLDHGSLGESVEMIMDSIMNDIFGQASEEKEADGYSKKTKEIKQNKSFDTGELIAANIFLKDFKLLLTPIKYLLRERLSHKTQTKLNDLMFRFAKGLQKNEESSSTDILILANEIYQQSVNFVENEEKKRKANVIDEKTQHFLVQLDAKAKKTQMEYSLYIKTLQQFAFELLRVSISKHPNLCKPEYLSHFVPYLVENLKSEDDGVVIASLKDLILFTRLDFGEEINTQFYQASETVLEILQDIPATDNDLCQTCLKFITAVARYKPNVDLKDTAFAYILKKIEPDLDTPVRQGTAFSFLKGLIAHRVMIPEIYDCMETVAKIMVTSVTNEIRQSARSVYYMFLMEYDQSKGKLEKQFKLLISNLKYPAEGGRLSVMELILTIVNKANADLLNKLSSSFFIALANVSITDLVPTCRESANEILLLMLSKLKANGADLSFIEKYTKAWINQNSKSLLIRCGLNVYENYIKTIGLGESPDLDMIVFTKLEYVLNLAKEKDENLDWQMIYSSMIVFEQIVENDDEAMDAKYENIWHGVISMMLYPHSWIRLSASRLISKLLKEVVDNDGETITFEINDSEIQNIAYRTFRQLGITDITDVMALQSTANLVLISRKWERDDTPFIMQKQGTIAENSAEDEKDDGDDETIAGEDIHLDKVDQDVQFDSAFDWALNRCAAILRNDQRGSKHMLVTKKAIISYCEFLTTFLSVERLRNVMSDKLLVPLLFISEQEIDENDPNPLPERATNCLDTISKKIGVSDYNVLLSSAAKEIQHRREERKAKRSNLAITNPELHARKKIQKHMKDRQKRKAHRDVDGFVKHKKRRQH